MLTNILAGLEHYTKADIRNNLLQSKLSDFNNVSQCYNSNRTITQRKKKLC